MEGICIVFELFIVGVIVYVEMQSSGRSKKATELKAIDTVHIGKYIAGLPTANTPTDVVECAITNESFIFLAGFGDELGRIPRDMINQIIVDDKSQISQRLTVTRMLTLGIFSLAAPKKKKDIEFCLVIDWNDERGIRNNTIFEFTGSTSNTLANTAANTLNKHIKSRTAIMESDEKKCPYCAETIKRAAKVCRFCNREF